ncbi:UNVERIFIED_CONTAM: Plant-specific TFIIB-related protein 1 [Sesamum radiatum]|uniref:Plant-specific TFIIB-related protein 1 n=1 Tax=Sesamum radiatum TaxID=300843 RepID=A0AAW2P2P3_SESRA
MMVIVLDGLRNPSSEGSFKRFQELATHIGEVVINKCFCTRRNPISISAAAIYLACQLEDKRKTQAEICKVTGLTEVTLRKVYKELLENWDDLLPSNYNPVVPPEKAFPTATISSGRSSSSRGDLIEGSPLDREKHTESRLSKPSEILGASHQSKGKDNAESKDSFHRAFNAALLGTPFWKPQVPVSTSANQRPPETNQISTQIWKLIYCPRLVRRKEGIQTQKLHLAL